MFAAMLGFAQESVGRSAEPDRHGAADVPIDHINQCAIARHAECDIALAIARGSALTYPPGALGKTIILTLIFRRPSQRQ
jgi:hypothetical protein